MNRPQEKDYASQAAYTRALEAYCDYLAQPEQSELQDAKDTIELLEMRIDQLEAPEQSEPTKRQYDIAMTQWSQWKLYALELHERLLPFEGGGSPMHLNTASPLRELSDEEIGAIALDVMGFSVLDREQAETARLLIRKTESVLAAARSNHNEPHH